MENSQDQKVYKIFQWVVFISFIFSLLIAFLSTVETLPYNKNVSFYSLQFLFSPNASIQLFHSPEKLGNIEAYLPFSLCRRSRYLNHFLQCLIVKILLHPFIKGVNNILCIPSFISLYR